MVSNVFYFYPYLGKWSNFTNIFQRGWNHQLDIWRSAIICLVLQTNVTHNPFRNEDVFPKAALLVWPKGSDRGANEELVIRCDQSSRITGYLILLIVDGRNPARKPPFGCIKLCKSWDVYHISWWVCRISEPTQHCLHCCDICRGLDLPEHCGRQVRKTGWEQASGIFWCWRGSCFLIYINCGLFDVWVYPPWN